MSRVSFLIFYRRRRQGDFGEDNELLFPAACSIETADQKEEGAFYSNP